MKEGTQNKSETPLITPEMIVSNKDFGMEQPLKKAILAFMPVDRMSDLFCEKNGRRFSFFHYWDAWTRDDGVVLVGPIFGGPACAAVVEELSALGVEQVVGYGYSGALEAGIPLLSIMVADSGFCSDGTSKEYTDSDEISADPEMLEQLLGVFRQRGIKPEAGKVWTTDAIFREFPSRCAYWKEKGAGFVNMETSPFYAVAREKGLRAVYLSVVSDCVGEEKWSGWSSDLEKPVEEMWGICLKWSDDSGDSRS